VSTFLGCVPTPTNVCLPRFRRGHVIDVSWAVVQRSQGQLVTSACCLERANVSIVGFLDGGDRSTALPVSIDPASPDEKETPSENTSTANLPNGPKSFVVSTAVTSALLIRNLPLLLFSQPSELEPLLLPFGQIKKLDMIETCGSDTATGFISVAVEYATADSAYEAKMTLDGQVYVNHVLNIEFVQSVPSACDVLVHQTSQFPLVDPTSPPQAHRRHPLTSTRYSYNSRLAGMNTTDGFFGAMGSTSFSAPTTPYPFSAGSGMSSYFSSNAPSLDRRLDDARPLARFAEA